MVYLHLINEVRGLASHGIPPNGTQLIVASLGAESECYSRVTLPAKAVILEHKISLARYPSDAKVMLNVHQDGLYPRLDHAMAFLVNIFCQRCDERSERKHDSANRGPWLCTIPGIP